MQFLKTLFWALLVGVIVAFALNNVTMVPLKLWGSLYADVNLPLLLLVVFLAGFVPTYIVHRTSRWRLRQRLAAAERALAGLHRGDTVHEPLFTAPVTDAPAPPAPAAMSGEQAASGRLL